MSSHFIYQKPTLALMVLHPAPLQPLQTHPPPQISMKPIATRLSAYTEFNSNSDSHYSDCLDPLNLADPPPTTENVFMRHLFDAQKSLETLSNIQGCIPGMKVKYMGATLNGKCAPQCRWENGSMHILPMETSFSYQNMSQLPQVKNPIIGRIFCWKSRSSVLQMFSKSGHNYLIKSAYFL